VSSCGLGGQNQSGEAAVDGEGKSPVKRVWVLWAAQWTLGRDGIAFMESSRARDGISFFSFFFFFIKDLHQIRGLTMEGIIDISCIKNHVQVTCVRLRLRLTMEMDGRGEIERN
jgi:hypothetical protein